MLQFRPHESDTGTHPVNMMEHIVLQTGGGGEGRGGGGGGEKGEGRGKGGGRGEEG